MYSSFNSFTNSKSYPQVSSSSDNDNAVDDVGEAKDVDEADDVVEDVNVDGDDGSDGNDEDDELDITIRRWRHTQHRSAQIRHPLLLVENRLVLQKAAVQEMSPRFSPRDRGFQCHAIQDRSK